ncbi:MAG: DUF4838 domain-containing protein [Chlorobi bacterium]|nr:DUF4838 domain-containing protein [Chlorobiota bacterium]
MLSTCSVPLKNGNVYDKRLNYTIVVPQEPSQTELFAAEELKNFLNKIYSKSISINGKNDDITFFIGKVVPGKKAGNNFKEGEFGIFRDGNNFTFSGFDDKDADPTGSIKLCTGTLSSVYYFMTKYLGVKFYFPGSNGYDFKKDQPVYFKDKSDIPRPSFVVRGISIRNSSYTTNQNILFFRRSLGNIPYWAKKDYYYFYLNKWKKRFEKEHPEYLGMYNGKRCSCKFPFHLPCFSNPDVLKITVNDILNVLENDLSIRTVRLFADCPLRFCMCDNCMAMPERKYIGETKENGEMVYGIVKKIMDKVHEVKPDVQFLVQTKIYTSAGSYYNPPHLVKMGPYCTVLHLTRRNRIPVFDHSHEVAVADAWLKDSVKLVLKSYERYPEAKDYPLIKPHLDQRFFKLFENKALGTINSEASEKVPYSFSALGQYLQMKMLFDINTDLDDEIRKFCAFAYPGAAEEMVRFYNYMEEIYSKRCEFSKPLFDDVYKFENLQISMDILNCAVDKVSPDSFFFDQLYNDFIKFYEKSKRFNDK